MSHFENLLVEYYDWRRFIVAHNRKVGHRPKGGWEMELDVVAFDPSTKSVLHLEPSLDADNWATREKRFEKKFAAGRKYIPTEVFPWLSPGTELKQVAILPRAWAKHRSLAGSEVRSVDEVMAEIRQAVEKEGPAARRAISEQYPLLRTIQLTVKGYYREPASAGNQ